MFSCWRDLRISISRSKSLRCSAVLCWSFFTATTSPVLSCRGSYLHISTLPKFPYSMRTEREKNTHHLEKGKWKKLRSWACFMLCRKYHENICDDSCNCQLVMWFIGLLLHNFIKQPHFSQLFEKDEVPLLKLRRLLALWGPREAEASRLVRHHVTLHQQLIVFNRTRCRDMLYMHRHHKCGCGVYNIQHYL